MISVNFHTNLDDVRRYEKFPKELAFWPMVGDVVESLTEYTWDYMGRPQKGRRLQLKVCRCVITGESSMDVELHLTGSFGQQSVSEFMKWYPAFRRGE